MLFLATMLFVCVNFSFAQPELPQRSISIVATQGLHFGTFCLTSPAGGTVIVGYDGSRSKNGDIALLSKGQIAHPAIFEIKLCEGRNITINFEPTIKLIGSNGGSLTLNIGPTEKGINGASFSTNSDCNFITPLRVGGILNVPGIAIPGIYSGSFTITFNQQ